MSAAAQQPSSRCSNSPRPEALIRQESRTPETTACLIPVASALNLTQHLSQPQRLVVSTLFLILDTPHTLSQATAPFGSEDLRAHPNKSICTAELKLCWSHQPEHFTGSGLLHRSPWPALRCPVPARLPALPAALRCGSLGARGKELVLNARSGAKSATDISRETTVWVLGTRLATRTRELKLSQTALPACQPRPLKWFLARGRAHQQPTGCSILAARLVHGGPVSCCWCDASPPISFSGIP